MVQNVSWRSLLLALLVLGVVVQCSVGLKTPPAAQQVAKPPKQQTAKPTRAKPPTAPKQTEKEKERPKDAQDQKAAGGKKTKPKKEVAVPPPENVKHFLPSPAKLSWTVQGKTPSLSVAFGNEDKSTSSMLKLPDMYQEYAVCNPTNSLCNPPRSTPLLVPKGNVVNIPVSTLPGGGEVIMVSTRFCQGKPHTHPHRICGPWGNNYIGVGDAGGPKITLTSYGDSPTPTWARRPDGKLTFVPGVSKARIPRRRRYKMGTNRRRLDGSRILRLIKAARKRATVVGRGKPRPPHTVFRKTPQHL